MKNRKKEEENEAADVYCKENHIQIIWICLCVCIEHLKLKIWQNAHTHTHTFERDVIFSSRSDLKSYRLLRSIGCFG